MRNEADCFLFRFVHAVRKRPGNGAPILAAIPDRYVVPGEAVRLDIEAHDPDGDFISFFAQVRGGDDVPPGSVITDHHDGTATFEWATRPEHAGTYVLRVAAFDEGGGEMFQDVTITVAGPAPTRIVAPSPTASPAPPPIACPGDCDGDDGVSIAELITGTRIALGAASPSDCQRFACYAGDEDAIVCLTRAVMSALNGCVPPF